MPQEGVNAPARNVETLTGHVGGPESGITRICCLDHELRLFENQYPVPDGMSYNSYFIDDEQPVVLDTVDDRATAGWLDAVSSLLRGREPRMLIVQHLEPDHSGSIADFMTRYPECDVVCTAKAAGMLPNFVHGLDLKVRTVKDGDVISTGHHELEFITAPMVHWPEVTVTYDRTSRVLFSADAFGTFGCAMAKELTDDTVDRKGAFERWIPEAARYYFNICGKYGRPVQQLIGKVGPHPVDEICPLHGPTISRSVLKAERIYDAWSRGVPDFPEGVFVAVATLHGYTLEAAEYLRDRLHAEGVADVRLVDLSRTDMSLCVSDAFRYGTIVFASATYDGALVPVMADFLEHLSVKGWCGRHTAIIENGSWAPAAARIIRTRLEAMKDVTVAEPVVTVRTRCDDTSRKAIAQLAGELAHISRQNKG